MPPPFEATIVRFHSLDALRGVAALIVVSWHWQHFFFQSYALPPDFRPTQMPLFEVLRVCYQSGWLAVDLFFTLSGFIFYWLYADAINERQVSGRTFFALRFSRLYPLHLITLLAVALAQLVYTLMQGHSFVYKFNDLRHFALSLLLLPSVGLERGYSFNGPVWSVSVEMMLYAAFFAVCRVTKPRLILLLCITVAAFLLGNHLYAPLHRGLRSFFLGGCVFYFYQWISMSQHARSVASLLATITLGLWASTITWVYFGLSQQEIPVLRQLPQLGPMFAVAVLFPCTILSLALVEGRRGNFGTGLSFLGDISYSSYLIHFPLQIIFALAAIGLGAGAEFFSKPLTVLVFYLVLIAVARASYRWFEMPAQRYLRGKLLTRRSSTQQCPSRMARRYGTGMTGESGPEP